jgi:hypothetical protein
MLRAGISQVYLELFAIMQSQYQIRMKQVAQHSTE